MSLLVVQLLKLAEETDNFQTPKREHWQDDVFKTLLLTGKGHTLFELESLSSVEYAWLNRTAIPFDLELAATGLLYQRLEKFTDHLIEFAFDATNNFSSVTSEWIYENPSTLPVLMHVVGTFSKQNLAKQVGAVSDRNISKPASKRLASLLGSVDKERIPSSLQVQQRIKSTVEGIVRDLVGRLLLEDFVCSALKKANVPFLREEEYESLPGVIYDFRADFVVPDALSPKAFLEVRKSSSRHASLYAKDKMFSAINWKGRHPECLGILVIDGPWTEVTLQIMSRIFDYVVPIGNIAQVARAIRDYLDGDKAVLQWLVTFRVERPPSRAIELDK